MRSQSRISQRRCSVPVETLAELEIATSPLGTALGKRRHEIAWLIDNAAAYDAVIEAIRGARRSVCISQLAFDADCEAYAESGASTRLLDVLVRAAATHALDVRILLNSSILVNTVGPLRAALSRGGADTIQVRGINRFPQLLHAKILVVDDREAFLLGSPFVNGYWDDPSHRPDDVRRPARELGGRPLHDLSIRVRGHAVAELRSLFDAWWEDVADERAPAPAPRRPAAIAARGVGARAVRTVPAGVLPRCPEGHTEILDAMVDGILRARELLYIEHQYLSSRRVIRALVEALARAPELEVIALVNQNPDVTAYKGWQNARLRESGLSEHPRFGLFALWSREQREHAVLLNQVFVHSKVIIADDEWATVGSANIDGVSLHSYGDDFESWLGGRVFRDVRNFDVNLDVRGDGGAMSDCIAVLRSALWSEHLGEGDYDDVHPVGGWLRRWHECAASNVAWLNAFPSGTADDAPRSFVLPYSREAWPSAQLAQLGIRARRELLLRFAPSWLEVHCSPNWIRNMFA
jgi:phosphatidylserine/phosphatidylglycerophosphate/cardiolipin synthase-like enzyme